MSYFVVALLAAMTEASCDADTACNANRICTFGDLKTYDLVRRTLFEATGYPLSCINLCSCPNQNSMNPVQRMLMNAHDDNSLYSNNTICSNAILHAAMIYHTENRECETIFTQAQTSMFELCGTQNGLPCMGHCTKQYEIDTPRRPCDVRKEFSPMTRVITMAGILIASVLVLRAPETENAIDLPVAPKYSSTLNLEDIF